MGNMDVHCLAMGWHAEDDSQQADQYGQIPRKNQIDWMNPFGVLVGQ